MSKSFRIIAIIAIVYSLLLACSKKQAEEFQPAVPGLPGAAAITYNNFVEPIFQTKCASCHATGRSAAAIFTLNGYSSVVANAARIKQAVLVNKTMPMGSSLSQSDLQSLQIWFDKGMIQQ
ncbi:hypothetical protein [Pedobacter duraquae]|uniref:Cytochrome c domain-containing protein n=1 Tax=Pedobacter duraquae TaxID=425511 RepID=A0A4R6IFN7_9SPHI|nr:hypothetical protein [Pedobacter duraquae]TDO20854.1 hypothetical protein CLV32_3488 [Pedobacter duraquae]